MTLAEYTVVALAALLSAIIKNGVGVGSGIFLLPMLSLVFPAKIALALGAPLMLGSDLMGLRLYWRQWASTRQLCSLLIPAIPGLILGVWLIPIIPGGIFRAAVGIFGMLYALCFLFPTFAPVRWFKSLFPPPRPEGSTLGAACYGMLGGMATVLAHAGGLVWSLYLVGVLRDRRVFVGTIVIMFALTNVYKTGAYVHIGILDVHSLLQTCTTIPAIVLGSWIGSWANKRVNQELFRRVVLCTIFATSAALLV